METQTVLNISDAFSEIKRNVNNAILSRLEVDTTEVCIVAVSKTKPIEDILEAYDAGCRHFGENYVNEFVEKANSSVILEKCPEIKWHFIGHLQSNKVNKLIGSPNLYMIQTIDSSKLADVVNKAWEKLQKPDPLKIMVQVNTSGEQSKSGIPIEEVIALIEHVEQKCPHLKCTGLMTIGSPNPILDQSGSNPDFEALMKCRQSVLAHFHFNHYDLSMGMSDDYVHAVASGSSCVRIGRVLFGDRKKV